MLISSLHSRAAAPSTEAASSSKQAHAASADAAPPARESAARVKVSPQAESLAREGRHVNTEKVEALRARFAQGSYSVDHMALARTMLSHA